MTLPASGQISMSTFSSEMGQSSTYSASLNWVNENTKSGQRPGTPNMGGYYSKAWYSRNQDGNCNNGNCGNCNCGNIQCTNCNACSNINCANCDTRAWLQNNCNCACTYNCGTSPRSYNCNCDCNCGNTCFLPGTQVFVEGGATKAIEDIEIGEKVVGLNGELNTVVGLWRPVLGKRKMYSVNGGRVVTTGDHMIHTPFGWAVLDQESYSERRGQAVTLIGGVKANLSAVKKVSQLEVGSEMTLFTGQTESVDEVEALELPEDTQLYTLATDGSYSFAIGSGVIVDGIPQEDK